MTEESEGSMFGFLMKNKEGVEWKLMPQTDLTYTFVDVDGEKFKTVNRDGYYFPVDDDGSISDGYSLTGEKVYVWDMYTNSRAEVFWKCLSSGVRYALEHKGRVNVTRFEVEEA